MRLLLPALVLACALGLAGPARGDCPMSTFTLGCWDGVVEPATAPTARSGGGDWTAGTACPGACYDGPHGALHAETASSIYDNPTGCTAIVDFSDDYQLVGGAPGQSYPCEARLLVTGAIVDTGSIFALMANTTGSLQSTTPGPVAGSIVLPLVLTSGQPVRLEAVMTVHGSYPTGAATADAVLRFAGLPQGVSVTSCRAYDLPVPAATATWGRLKATYR